MFELSRKGDPQIIVIGGSAGSFRIVTRILSSITDTNYPVPIVLCLHRLKSVRKGFAQALNFSSGLEVVEPEDKDGIKLGKIYLAPANYHLTVELGKTFALSTEEMVHNSRPSIDMLFQTAAYVYRHRAVGILLSGANRDGVEGLAMIHRKGGRTIVQDPDEAEIKTMPESALQRGIPAEVLDCDGIIAQLRSLQVKGLV